MKKRLYILLSFMSILWIASCQESEKSSLDDWINGVESDLEFPMEGGIEEFSITLENELDISLLECNVPIKDKTWCEAIIEGNKLTISTYRSYVESNRNTDVTITHGKNYSYVIRINQEAGFGENDTKIRIMTATADTENKNNEMDKSYDGDPATYFCSKGGIDVVNTFRMTYTLENGHTLYRIVYTPRSKDNKWGSFNKFDVEVATEDAPTLFFNVASFERGDNVHTPFDFKLNTPVPNAKYVRFSVHSAYMKRVSCVEMDFYEPSKNVVDYSSIFSNTLYTELKEGVTEWQIKNLPDNEMRQLAIALFAGNYDNKYRVAHYRPYQNPAIMAALNRTSKYSLSDNPTGIYAVSGEKLYVAMDETYEGAQVSLMIRDLNGGYGNSKTYKLSKGLNIIEPKIGGLIYVLNHVDDNIPLLLETDEAKQAAAAQTIKIHFVMGKVNGLYDRQKNIPEEWPEMLKNAPYQDIDVLGKYAHVTWRVSDFLKYNTDVIKLLDNFDRLVWLEEDFIGLIKYGKMFNNRMHFSIDYAAKSPNASNYRTVYPDGNARKICNTETFEEYIWGPAHEAGHVNQTKPGLKWIGMTEVTNNILSMYVQASFHQISRLLALSNGKTVYEIAQEKIIKAGTAHNSGEAGLFERLVPFWQLKLYVMDVLEQKDFYRDLYEYFRTYDYKVLNADKYTQGIYQLDFVRQVCRISQLNLLDFFEKWGFLTPIDKDINDYSTGHFTITEEQIEALKQEINGMGYDMPHPELHLINENNISNY